MTYPTEALRSEIYAALFGSRATPNRWDECDNCYGNGCGCCGYRGQIENREWRDAYDDHLSDRADARRKGEDD